MSKAYAANNGDNLSVTGRFGRSYLDIPAKAKLNNGLSVIQRHFENLGGKRSAAAPKQAQRSRPKASAAQLIRGFQGQSPWWDRKGEALRIDDWSGAEGAKSSAGRRSAKMVVCARLELATSPMSRERATNCANRPLEGAANKPQVRRARQVAVLIQFDFVVFAKA